MPKLLHFTKTIEIDEIILRIANEELALLDALLIHKSEEGINTYLLEKFVKKFSKTLKREILGQLVSLKYLTAINRLRVLAKKLKEDSLYGQCLDIIRQEGANCFVSIK